MLGNNVAYSLAQNYGQLMVGDGSIDPNGVKMALELEGIPEEEYTTTTLKVINYIATALAVGREDDKLNET